MENAGELSFPLEVEEPRQPDYRDSQLKTNVFKLSTIRILGTNIALGVPVFNLIWNSAGMDLSAIFLLEGLFMLLLACAEIPTGFFADKVGRKRSLVVGYALEIVSLAVYSTSHSFNGFLVAELVGGLAMAFVSGADRALLYDTLKERGEANRFLTIWSAISFRMFLATGAFTILGGFLSQYGERIPLYLACGLMVVNFVLSLTLSEAKPSKETQISEERLSAILHIRNFISSKRLRWLMIFPAVVSTSLCGVMWFYVPYALAVGLDKKLLGVMFCLFNVVSAIGAHLAPRLQKKLPELGIAFVCVVGISLSYGAMGMGFTIVGLFFVLLHQLVRGAYLPIFDSFLQEEIGSALRATISSIQSLFFRIGAAVVYLCSSRMMGDHIPSLLLYASLLVMVIGVLAIVVLFQKHHEINRV